MWFLPKDPKFYDIFEEMAANLDAAGSMLAKIAAAPEIDTTWEQEITSLEHAGDALARSLYQAEEASFVVPFSHENLRGLTTTLDDVLDEVEDAVRKIVHYSIVGDPELNEMLGVASHAIAAVHRGVALLRKLSKSSLDAVTADIVKCEHEADFLEFTIIKNSYDIDIAALGRDLLALRGKVVTDCVAWEEYLALRQMESDYTNGKRKRREIAEILERAVDKCRDVFHILGKIKSEL